MAVEASAPEKITHPAEPDLEEEEDKAEKQLQPKGDVPEVQKAEEDEEEEEETCAFCKFMKAGGCKDVFVSWMECVDSEKEKEHDFVETCMPQIQALRECMLANPDYYRPMLDEEDAFLEEKETVDSKQAPESNAKAQESNSEASQVPSMTRPTSS